MSIVPNTLLALKNTYLHLHKQKHQLHCRNEQDEPCYAEPKLQQLVETFMRSVVFHVLGRCSAEMSSKSHVGTAGAKVCRTL